MIGGAERFLENHQDGLFCFEFGRGLLTVFLIDCGDVNAREERGNPAEAPRLGQENRFEQGTPVQCPGGLPASPKTSPYNQWLS